MHNFSKSLKKSQDDANDPIWEKIFDSFFPGCKLSASYDDDLAMQKSGIDDVIKHEGSYVWIDRKTRFPRSDGRVYSDILLEYLSDKARNTPGWICKSTKADYWIYFNRMNSTCHLIPVKVAQVVWEKHKNEWLKRYHSVPAYNEGWITLSLGVPLNVLSEACEEFGKKIRSIKV